MARPKGIPISPEHKAKLIAANRARKYNPHTAETRAKIAKTVKERWMHIPADERSRMRSGPNHPQWIEDRTKLKITRNGVDQNLLIHWRRAVFERDKFTCQKCGKVGGKLNGDHIKPVSLFPELALELINGRTLCFPCHKQTPTFCGRVRLLTREDFT